MFGGLPYFPENDNQVFGTGYRFGGGWPFFPKIGHQGLVLGTNLGWVSTPLGTQKVKLVPSGLVSYFADILRKNLKLTLSNSSIHTTPPSASTIAPPSIIKFLETGSLMTDAVKPAALLPFPDV